MSDRSEQSSDPPGHYPPELFELVHRGTPGDLAFYHRICTGARDVLELGCGYGRVLAALSDLPVSLAGIERDPGLLALAGARFEALPAGRSARIELVLGDIRDFDLSFRGGAQASPLFDRILIPHSGVYCLLSDEDCMACFRCVARHLKPGGELVLDAYVADHFHATEKDEDHRDERLEPVVSVESGGTCFDVFERSEWDRAQQRLDVTYEYIPRGGGEAFLGRIPQRYLLQGQLEELLSRSGLRLVSLSGDWEGGPVRLDGEFYVAVARRADDEA